MGCNPPDGKAGTEHSQPTPPVEEGGSYESVADLPIDELASHAALEEPRAAIAGEYAIVLARASVATDHTDESQILSLHARHR